MSGTVATSLSGWKQTTLAVHLFKCSLQLCESAFRFYLFIYFYVPIYLFFTRQYISAVSGIASCRVGKNWRGSPENNWGGGGRKGEGKWVGCAKMVPRCSAV